MSDRKKLDEEMNRINELYQQKDLELRKAGGTIEQRQQMRDLLNNKKAALVAEHGDDLAKLNQGQSIKVSNANPRIPSSLGKKLLGVLPLAGGLAQAMSSQDVLAAIDPTDSEDVGKGSDLVDPLQNEEALMNIPHENFADKDVAEQARRWQKIRGSMGN